GLPGFRVKEVEEFSYAQVSLEYKSFVERERPAVILPEKLPNLVRRRTVEGQSKDRPGGRRRKAAGVRSDYFVCAHRVLHHSGVAVPGERKKVAPRHGRGRGSAASDLADLIPIAESVGEQPKIGGPLAIRAGGR